MFDYSITIDGIYFDGASSNAISCFPRISNDYKIANCTFTGTYDEAVLFLNGASGEIVNCVFHDLFVEVGEKLFGDLTTIIFILTEEVQIVNNTFINNETTCSTIYFSGYEGSLHISNNVFQDETDYHLFFHYFFTPSSDFTFSNNVLTTDAIVEGYGCEVYDTLYELMDIQKDLNQPLRPQGLSWDLGAIEYNPLVKTTEKNSVDEKIFIGPNPTQGKIYIYFV